MYKTFNKWVNIITKNIKKLKRRYVVNYFMHTY